MDGLEHIVPAKQKSGKDIPYLSQCHQRIGITDFFQRGFIRRETLLLLIVIPRKYLDAAQQLTAVRFFLPHDHFEQRGFSGSVRAQQRDLFAALDEKIHMREQRFAVKGLGELMGCQDIVPAQNFGREGEFHCLFVGDRFFNDVHPFQHLFATLRSFYEFFLRKRAELGDDLFLTADLCLLGFVFTHGGLDAGILFLNVKGIIAGIDLCRAAFQFDGTSTDFVQKISVMGNDQSRAGKGGEVFLQPGDGIDIQMVGRLVQKQKIRFLQQKLT